MHQILASDFGNLLALITGVPIAVISLLIGIPCAFANARPFAITFGIACIIGGIWIFWSLGSARTDDYKITIIFGIGSIVAGVALVIWKQKSST